MQDASGMRTRHVHASAKPRDKAAADVRECHTLFYQMQDVSEMRAGCIWDVCECHLGAELYCSINATNLFYAITEVY